MAKSHYQVEQEGIAAQLKKKKDEEKKKQPSKYPEIISGSHQDPNDPNVIRGDSGGAWKGTMDDPNRARAKEVAANNVRAAQARKKRRWYNPMTWGATE